MLHMDYILVLITPITICSGKINGYLAFSNYSGELISELSLNMHLVGIQLGYQFVFWDRLTLDVVFMGPGLWFFDMKTTKKP